MKRILSILMVAVFMLTGCARDSSSVEDVSTLDNFSIVETAPQFLTLDDPDLLTYIEDSTYMQLIDKLDSDELFIEHVDAIYLSKEYLEEVEYNSLENVFFGYTLSELDQLFEGTKYIFNVDEDGNTTVEEYQELEDGMNSVLKDLAIGTGVILFCVTVSAVSGGLGAPAVSMIFAASAKGGAIAGLTGGAFSAVSAGVVEGFKTKSWDNALDAALVNGADGFKWGVIVGAITGGVKETTNYAKAMSALKGVELNGLTMQQAAAIQMESGYPVSIIKQFNSMEQYNICKQSGLTCKMVNGKAALVRDIDLDYIDEVTGKTNLQLMEDGKAPFDSSGIKYELHHVGQKTDSPLAILTQAEHRQNGNDSLWHILTDGIENPSSQPQWQHTKQSFWKSYAKIVSEKS